MLPLKLFRISQSQRHKILWWGKFLLQSLVPYINLAEVLQWTLNLQLEMVLSLMINNHQRLSRRSKPQLHKRKRLRIITWKKQCLNPHKVTDNKAQWCKKNLKQYLLWQDLQWSLCIKLTKLQQWDKRQFQPQCKKIQICHKFWRMNLKKCQLIITFLTPFQTQTTSRTILKNGVNLECYMLKTSLGILRHQLTTIWESRRMI